LELSFSSSWVCQLFSLNSCCESCQSFFKIFIILSLKILFSDFKNIFIFTSVSGSKKFIVFGLQFSINSSQTSISQEKSFALKVSSKLGLKSKFTLQSFCVSSQIYSSFCSYLSSK